ncbi:MAG: hypothetical protein LBD70_00310, partial [Bifidobacteriaceae bacterium]|nr:hypothetical protein [Bifidobacteriaceae bacterium]
MGRYDLADQRAFASGQAVYAVSDAAQAVSLTGPDALKLVSALTTLPPGPAGPPPSGAEALALDSQGHILFGLAIRPAEDGDGLLVLTDGPAEELAELINSRRFRLRALAAPRPEVKVLVTPRRVEGFGLAAFEDGWPGPNEDSGLIWPRYALDRPHPGAALTGLAAHVYDPRADWSAPDRLEAMGYRQIDAAVLEGLRIAAWRPLASREAADSKTLPHELDWLRATTPIGSGCYPGQETVARIVNLGKPPRRLVMLHLDGSDAALPAPGAEVWAAGADEARGTGRAGSPPAPGAEVWAAGPGAADGGRPD